MKIQDKYKKEIEKNEEKWKELIVT